MTDEASQSADASSVADLESVLAGTATIIGGVSKDQAHLRTACPDFDVAQLVDHVVGWAGSFAARLSGREPGVDPATFRAGPDPRAQLEGFAAEIVAGYRHHSPGAQSLPIGVLLMDLQAHGWDLAVATGQQVPFGEHEAETALAAGRQMLKPEYRGAGKAFGPEVTAAEGATALEQLVAFLGRDPSWTPPAR
jgi:uncharacterized protein (TIGR03086 family)